MNDLLNIGASAWHVFPLGVFVVAITLGFMPGRLLRLIVWLYPKRHPRRDELIAELYVLGYLKRPVWVLEQLETALTEGCRARIQARRERAARARLPEVDERPSRVKAQLIQMLSSTGDGKVEVVFEREDAKELMLLLFHECSAMVAALGEGSKRPVRMQVYDNDRQEIPIDEADPPVRTAVRTLLAEVHGNTEAAKTHIEIALANWAPEEAVMLMKQALRWTIRLSQECTTRDLQVADWITDALN